MSEQRAPLRPLRGLVLAGGRSERLGRDKAALVVEGQTLLARAVTLLSATTSAVHVAVRQDQLDEALRGHYTLLADVRAGIGPAAGLLAAHERFPEAAWLLLACDMPWVTQAMLTALCAARGERPAVAFRSAADGLPEPLCAIYEPATLAPFRSQVDAGGSASLRGWLADTACRLLDAPGPQALGSINTLRDLDGLTGTRRAPDGH